MKWTAKCDGQKFKGMTVCDDPNNQIGDIRTNIYYLFSSDRLASIELGFASENYAALVRAFSAKFGEPDTTWTEVWQNRMGAKFDNQSVAWLRGRGILLLSQFGSRLSEGTGTLISQDVLRAKQQTADSAAQRAQQDL